ncbi:MAG: helix-turn-helix transcriptional regulator [Oscillospiraceae bacterium]
MFCELLKKLRSEKGVSQPQLAQALGVSNGNVGDWERGRSKPGFDAIIALSQYFCVSADFLLELSEDKNGGLRENDTYKEDNENQPLLDDFLLLDNQGRSEAKNYIKFLLQKSKNAQTAK